MTTPGSNVHDASGDMPPDCRTRVLRCASACRTLTCMRTARLSERLWAELIAALAPPVCLACRVPLATAGAQLCLDCRRALPWLSEPRCRRCGLPLPCGTRDSACPAAVAAFEQAWAPLAHDGSAGQVGAALEVRGALPV